MLFVVVLVFVQPIVLVFVFVLAIVVFVVALDHLSLVVFWGGCFGLVFACICFVLLQVPPKHSPCNFRGVSPFSLPKPLSSESFFFNFPLSLWSVSSC